MPNKAGGFERPETVFRRRVTADGSSGFPAERGRYHLYVAEACPWAHRTLITRALRGLKDVIDVTTVDPHMGDDGWAFPADGPDPLLGAAFLRDVYLAADAKYTGRVTVPILWDKHTATIVNNESREIMRMLDVEFAHVAIDPALPTLAPEALRASIDRALDAIYAPINNGVYRTGFATTQAAYESACRELFAALTHWDAVLATSRYTCGSQLTEADVALFTTLVRFDLVYHGHFKCNLRRIQDFPNLWGFLRDLYSVPAIAKTCNFDAIKTHYYWSHPNINPTRIVPIGPEIDFAAPHDRAKLGGG